MKYTPPLGSLDVNAPYVDGNPSAGIRGSVVPAAPFNQLQRELVNVITDAGLTPSDTDLTQLLAAIKIILASGGASSAVKLATARAIDGVVFDGSSAINHYAVCSTAASVAAKTVQLAGFNLVSGAEAVVLFTNGNTAASPTLNVSSTGAKGIKYCGNAVESLPTCCVCQLVYDGASWQLIALNNYGDGVTADATHGEITVKDIAIGGAVSDLASKRGQIGETFSLGTGKNLNDIVASGNYWIFATDAQNVPVANSGFLLVYRNSNNITQLYIAYNTATIYVRVSNDSGQNWGDWKKFAMSDTGDGFLPLSGGTMTGTIESSSVYALKHTADNSTLRIFGGASVSESPAIYMHGKNATANAGDVQIIARAGAELSNILSLTPSGAMTFAGKNIVRSINGISANASGDVALDILSSATFKKPVETMWEGTTSINTLSAPQGGTWFCSGVILNMDQSVTDYIRNANTTLVSGVYAGGSQLFTGGIQNGCLRHSVICIKIA